MCKKLIYLISLVSVLIMAQSVSADLVGHWLLDGDGTDSSDYGNHGTINGNVSPAVDRFGNPSGAMSFAGGGGDNINVGDAPEFNMTGAMTITAWVYLDSTSSVHGGRNGRIVGKMGAGGRRAWSTGIEKNVSGVPLPGTIQVSSNGSDVIGLHDNSSLPLDQWVHYAGVYTPGTSLEVYLNGELSDIRTDGIPVSQYSTNGQSVLIGNRPEAGDCGWYGSLDDVRIYDEALTAAEILQVMIGVPPGAASDPSPADGATDVPRDVVLSWTPGEFAPAVNGHVIFLSDDFDDVNEGTPNVNDFVGGIRLSDASYAPAKRLDFETTYYWRVDEVNGPPDYSVHKGNIWSFKTEPVGLPITNVTATASSSAPDQGPASAVVDGSGLTDDVHSTVVDTMWASGWGAPQPSWIEFEFDRLYVLHEMWVWNSNTMLELSIGYGFKDVTIEYSLDGVEYATLGTTHEFARAPGADGYAHNTTIDFGGVQAKYVRLTAKTNWAAFPFLQFGLSEVRFFHIPVRARKPNPDSGATNVDVDAALTFRAGRQADQHNVYVSTEEQAVIDGTAPVTVATEASHSPAPLDLGRTYYWRVDEVNDAEIPTVWQGDVWNFSTQEYLVVEDFESYNDIEWDKEDSNLVFFTWIDGYVEPPKVRTNGSTIGHTEPFEPSMETSIVYEGSQSAPLYYDNSVVTFSEVTAYITNQPSWASNLSISPDWTKNGIKTLSLWFYGGSANVPGQLYVKVNDVKVTYEGDARNLTTTAWQPWNIDLTSLGVNLQTVTSLAIGIDGPGATGILFIDGIRLYAYERKLVTPSNPGTAGLVALYHLNLNTSDGSGNGHGGIIEGTPVFTQPGWEGQGGGACMRFGGDSDRITVESFDVTGTGITLSAWIKPTTFKNDARMISKSQGSGTADHYWAMVLSGSNENSLQFRLRTDVGGTTSRTSSNASGLAADEWTHVAVTWDASDPFMRMFKNGQQIDQLSKAGNAVATAAGVKIGIGNQSVSAGPTPDDMTRPFDGLMDEIRIYDRGLPVEQLRWLAGRTQPYDEPF